VLEPWAARPTHGAVVTSRCADTAPPACCAGQCPSTKQATGPDQEGQLDARERLFRGGARPRGCCGGPPQPLGGVGQPEHRRRQTVPHAQGAVRGRAEVPGCRVAQPTPPRGDLPQRPAPPLQPRPVGRPRAHRPRVSLPRGPEALCLLKAPDLRPHGEGDHRTIPVQGARSRALILRRRPALGEIVHTHTQRRAAVLPRLDQEPGPLPLPLWCGVYR